MPRRMVRLTRSQVQQLQEQRDHAPQAYVRERCAAILKIGEGHSPHWVARHGLLKPRDPDTVYAWLGQWEREGLVGLSSHAHGGMRRGRPSTAQTQDLVEQLCHPPEPHGTEPTMARWTLRTVRQRFA